MAQLRQFSSELAQLSVDVLVLTFEEPRQAKRYVEETQLPWPLLIDQARTLYGTYGMERASWSTLLKPATWSVYAKLMAKGRRPRKSTGDVKQLGGDVLIDPEGIVRMHHISDGPADRPPIDEILQIVRDRNPKRQREGPV